MKKIDASKEQRFKKYDEAVEQGVGDAIVNMAGSELDSISSIIRCFAEATTMADTYWELLRLMVKDKDTVEKLADKIRSVHVGKLRVSFENGQLELQVSDEVPDIH